MTTIPSTIHLYLINYFFVDFVQSPKINFTIAITASTIPPARAGIFATVSAVTPPMIRPTEQIAIIHASTIIVILLLKKATILSQILNFSPSPYIKNTES